MASESPEEDQICGVDRIRPEEVSFSAQLVPALPSLNVAGFEWVAWVLREGKGREREGKVLVGRNGTEEAVCRGRAVV